MPVNVDCERSGDGKRNFHLVKCIAYSRCSLMDGALPHIKLVCSPKSFCYSYFHRFMITKEATMR